MHELIRTRVIDRSNTYSMIIIMMTTEPRADGDRGIENTASASHVKRLQDVDAFSLPRFTDAPRKRS